MQETLRGRGRRSWSLWCENFRQLITVTDSSLDWDLYSVSRCRVVQLFRRGSISWRSSDPRRIDDDDKSEFELCILLLKHSSTVSSATLVRTITVAPFLIWLLARNRQSQAQLHMVCAINLIWEILGKFTSDFPLHCFSRTVSTPHNLDEFSLIITRNQSLDFIRIFALNFHW